MNLRGFEEFSPISSKLGEPKDLEMSSSWNIVTPSHNKTFLSSLNQQSQISLLMARNKMARVLDCVFANRVRYPFQLIKRKILFTDTDITPSEHKQSRIRKPEDEEVDLGIDTLERMRNKNRQKWKVLAFSLLKMVAEERKYREAHSSVTLKQLQREQIQEGMAMVGETMSRRVRSQCRQAWLLLKEGTRFKTECSSKAHSNVRFQSTIVEEVKSCWKQKRDYFTPRVYSKERVQTVLAESNRCSQPAENSRTSDLRNGDSESKKVIQVVYIMREKSESRHKLAGSKDRFLKIPYLSDNVEIKELNVENRRPSKHKYSSSGGIGKVSSSKPKEGPDCCCDNRTAKKVLSCRFCKLFMDHFLDSSRKPQPKYKFFNR